MNRIDFYKSTQSWNAVVTRKVLGHILRIRVKRNSYDLQSFGVVHRWNGSEWLQLDHLPIVNLPKATQAVYHQQPIEKAQAGLLEGVEFMLRRSQEFFEMAGPAEPSRSD